MAKTNLNIAGTADFKPIKTGSAKFNKQQILTSQRYRDQRDLLSALLKDGEKYSHGEVKKLIDEFKERKVK